MTTFIEDFTRSENSDEIFAIIGRALVIATRFDTMCKTIAHAADLKLHAFYGTTSDEDFESLIKKVQIKYSTLNKAINRLILPDDLSTILHDARKARNEIAHDLAIGMEGCLDTKVNMQDFLSTLSICVKSLAHGDALISALLQSFNNDYSIHQKSIDTYIDRISHWVIER